jgi:hypothetical protein
MVEKRPTKEFGKRRPEPLPLTPKNPVKEPVKRSGHVALLVMGTIAVGSTAYALMPRQTCQPNAQAAPGAAAPPGQLPGQLPGQPPSQPQDTACSSRGSSGSGGSGYHSSRWGFFSSSDASSHSSSSGTSSDSGSGGVTRGGFGSFAHAFGFSGHGGG